MAEISELTDRELDATHKRRKRSGFVPVLPMPVHGNCDPMCDLCTHWLSDRLAEVIEPAVKIAIGEFWRSIEDQLPQTKNSEICAHSQELLKDYAHEAVLMRAAELLRKHKGK